MGATNSVPQTVLIDNPDNEGVPPVISMRPEAQPEPKQIAFEQVELSDSVKSGILQMQQTTVKETETEVATRRVYKDTKEKQFDKTSMLLEDLLGKPIYWLAHHADALDQMHKALLDCYKEYQREPLRCADLSKQYQDFVLSEQFRAIKEHKRIHED